MQSRRQFLKASSSLSLGFLGLKHVGYASTNSLHRQTEAARVANQKVFGYGPTIPDPKKIFDLPKGFSYEIIATTGEKLDDDFYLPGKPDGMAAFPTQDGRIAIICNHELDHGDLKMSPYGPTNQALSKRSPETLYDDGYGKTPHLGGTSTIIYNPVTGQKDLHYLSLAGTERNCAGGPTPWNTWISCEETTSTIDQNSAKDHGYNFEVPVSTEIIHVEPKPLKSMGRFKHEAVAVEPKSGIVYQTEDLADGLIYRFIPNQKGKLAEGGRLQALAIHERASADTRNWPQSNQPSIPLNQLHDVKWIDLDDVESPKDDLRYRGYRQGAARFARGEGMWYGNSEIYFACTNGGRIQKGQVFRYLPSPFEGTARESEAPGRLELFVESSSTDLLKNCDNLTVASDGNLFLCEDAGNTCGLVGVTPEGKLFDFGRNHYTDSELAGACFSPDGNVLFLNIQANGQTLAITGPWGQFRS